MYHVSLEYLNNVRTKMSLGNRERILFKGEKFNCYEFQKIIKNFLYNIYIHIKMTEDK